MKKNKLASFITGAALSTAAAGAAAALAQHSRKGHPDFGDMKDYIYAHRGFHCLPDYPENSMAAFRRAAARGWGAELDVHLLRDGTLAVFHDSSLKRMTGVEGNIEDLDLAALKELRLKGTDEQIPLFDEVLKIFEGRLPLIIELKTAGGNHSELAMAVCKRLESYRGLFALESFDPRAIAAVRHYAPDYCVGILWENFMKDDDPDFSLPLWQKLTLTGLFTNFFSSPDFVAYNFADRNSLPLNACLKLWEPGRVSWTIRSRTDFRFCKSAGIIPIFEGFDPEE
ncbi:MAG: hypothetical protein MJ067_04900 [Oscillospiraceae bacterium]|nr:hypothetical protein [Oscillospiraceae bacterium]